MVLQSAPLYVDVDALREDLTSVKDVVAIHELHVWGLNSAVVTDEQNRVCVCDAIRL